MALFKDQKIVQSIFPLHGFIIFQPFQRVRLLLQLVPLVRQLIKNLSLCDFTILLVMISPI